MITLEQLNLVVNQTVHLDGVPYRVLGSRSEGTGRNPSVRVECLDKSVVNPQKTIRVHLLEEFQPETDIETPVVEAPGFKILVLDIETRPNLAYVWRVWKENIAPNQILEEKEVISFAAKWLGEPTVFYSTHTHSRQEMLQTAWNLLDQADAVVHYNGKRFDVPHMNLEFLTAGFTPPSPFRNIDLLATVKREFRFTHNKLDHVVSTLGIGNKVDHEGFDLWVKCMQGDQDAWERMETYNRHDVELTERLYYELLPWITNHPSHAAMHGDIRCTNCGSPDLKLNGKTYTKTGVYQRYRCACGKTVRDTKRLSGAPVTETSTW